MPTLKEYLIEHRNEIACNQCGKCCPDSCVLKKPDNSCASHPEIIGEAAASKKRGVTCVGDPVYFTFNGVACEPVLRVVTAVTGSIVEEEMLPNGQCKIKDYEPGDPTSSFRKFLDQEIIPLSATIFDSS